MGPFLWVTALLLVDHQHAAQGPVLFEEMKRRMETKEVPSSRLLPPSSSVCRHAVKANDPLHERELQKLLEDLLVCDMAYCCPHGRPTLIQINYAELERKFGRRA